MVKGVVDLGAQRPMAAGESITEIAYDFRSKRTKCAKVLCSRVSIHRSRREQMVVAT